METETKEGRGEERREVAREGKYNSIDVRSKRFHFAPRRGVPIGPASSYPLFVFNLCTCVYFGAAHNNVTLKVENMTFDIDS